MVFLKVALAHRAVHCAGRPKDVSPTLCFALQSCGCHGRVIELRGNPTMVRSDAKSETTCLQMSNLRRNSKVAGWAAFRSEHDPQSVTLKKLPDATTILRSRQPSHAQNHGACLYDGNVFTETPHSLSDVLPAAAPQE